MTNPQRDIAADTHAVILAAGMGTRLKHNTQSIPKCLVRVAGRPILERMLDTLAGLGLRRITVVVGYLGGSIRQFATAWAERYPEPVALTFIENEQFAQTGSVVSLQRSLLASQGSGDATHLLLIEGDVVIDPLLLRALLDRGAVEHDAATLLAPYEPILSGTFATVANGRVTAWLHESVRSADFDLPAAFKTVNLSFVKRGAPRRQLLDQVNRVIDTAGPKAPLEFAMQGLVEAGMRIAAVTTGTCAWFEVDTPEDLEIANTMFADAASV